MSVVALVLNGSNMTATHLHSLHPLCTFDFDGDILVFLLYNFILYRRCIPAQTTMLDTTWTRSVGFVVQGVQHNIIPWTMLIDMAAPRTI